MNRFTKLAAVVLVLAVVGVAAPAQAVTVSELQAQIDALLSQLSSLQGGSASTGGYAYNVDLTIGSTGADVTALQNYLISKGYLNIPAATGYFGPLTAEAVKLFQAANGVPATGYVGQLTRGKLNAMGGSSSTTGGSTSGLSGGDGDFKDFDVLGNPDSTDIEESATEEVLGFEFEARDSDLLVERVDVLFAEMGANTDKPWKVLDEVNLTIDGKEVASIDASDSDSWTEEENDEYSVRFDGLKTTVKEGDKVKAYIEVTAQDTLETADLGTWNVELMEDGVRARNAIGIDVYESGTGADDNIDSDADERDFTLEVATVGAMDMTVRSDDNESTVVEVDDDNETNEVLLYTAELESEDGDNTIEEVTVTIATTSASTNGLSDFIKTLYLFIDGEEVGSETVSDDDGSEAIVFDDLSVEVAEDEMVDVEVKADIDSQDGNYATSTTGVFVDQVVIDFVDQNDDDQTLTEATNGGNITFNVAGISVVLSGTPSAEVEYGQYSGDNDRGIFTISFKVTAFGTDDIYIGGEGSTSNPNAGVTYDITATSSVTVTKVELTSTADEGDNSTFVVNSGDTETFTFVVEVTDASTTAADAAQKINITGIKWDTDDDATPDNTYTSNLDDLKTPSKTI